MYYQPLEIKKQSTILKEPEKKLENKSPSPVLNKTSDTTTTRVRKFKTAKDVTAPKKDNAARRIQVKELKATVEEPTNHDVQFLIQVGGTGIIILIIDLFLIVFQRRLNLKRKITNN